MPKSPESFRRLPPLAVVLVCLLPFSAIGCGFYSYEYVLNVRCEWHQMPKGTPLETFLGVTPPVKVTITCDDVTTVVNFDPAGETKTLRFGEQFRVMIDGTAQARGFTVRIERPTYKAWSAEYVGNKVHTHLMKTDGWSVGDFIRLDSIVLEPVESPEPSRRVSGGPCMESGGSSKPGPSP